MKEIQVLNVDIKSGNNIEDISKKLKEKYNLNLPKNLINIYSLNDVTSTSFNSLEVYTFNAEDQVYVLKAYSQSQQNKNPYLRQNNKKQDELFIKLSDMYNKFGEALIDKYESKTYEEKTQIKIEKFSKQQIIENIRVKYKTNQTAATDTVEVSNLLLVKEDNREILRRFDFTIKMKR